MFAEFNRSNYARVRESDCIQLRESKSPVTEVNGAQQNPTWTFGEANHDTPYLTHVNLCNYSNDWEVRKSYSLYILWSMDSRIAEYLTTPHQLQQLVSNG
jgi:hypothetical protein